ncbi:D-alanine--D-alanine ligase [Steroidobacter sp. S1-65]|uniref:D-alanine--D-alanine ligase n=1 Tax=Steroidobacter gossypii TaxID=2805490 RepID=A0ABS1WUI0_9GAMM|nr:D-alanine--D-alanine ligase family protein [Steroidobacter gossypii]MBM0104634.1 D-alanine--D-alanine ligase [Steroidobacter gossypii]
MAQSGKIRVGILFGGQSTEHEISILSARNVLAALDRTRFEPLLIGIDKAGRWLLQDEQKLLACAADPRRVALGAGRPLDMPATLASADPDSNLSHRIDVIFPVLHGTFGEDGALQGLLEIAGIPYVGAGVLGSGIGMDKDVMKRLLRDAGIPVANFRTVRRPQFDADPRRVCEELATLGFPMFTKPANAGSSVGIRKVAQPTALAEAIRFAFEFDTKVIVEAAVSAREIELAVLGGNPATVTVAGEIVVDHPDGFYSYDAKYVDEHGARLDLPARISPDQQWEAQALALRTFEVLECDGMARVDLFLTSDGKLLVNEINTLPGFTAVSMYPKLWSLSGVPPTELITRLIELALQRSRARAGLRRSVPRTR